MSEDTFRDTPHPPGQGTRLGTLVCLVHVLLGCFFFHTLSAVLATDDTACVQLEMETASPGLVRLYFDPQWGFDEKDSMAVQVAADGKRRTYAFVLRGERVRALRLDPPEGGGAFVITGLRLVPRAGDPPVSIPLSRIEARRDIAGMALDGGRLTVTVGPEAPDPQLLVRFDEPLAIDGGKPDGYLTQAEAAAAVGLILVVLVLLWRARTTPAGAFFATTLLPGVILGMMLALAVESPLDSHPDERQHVEAARVFTSAWLPPAVDDPRLIPSLSKYGYSYAQDGYPVYWLIGLATRVLELAPTYYQTARLLNVALFFFLAALLLWRERLRAPLTLVLLCSPQLFYTFSYFNGDAFPLFLTLLTAVLLAEPDNPVGRFLSSPSLKDDLFGGVILAGLMGLTAISKPNYLLVLAFFFGLALLDILRDAAGKRRRLLKLAALAACVTAVYGLNAWYQDHINGYERDRRMAAFVELHADKQYKPSKFTKGEGQFSLRLRDKGVDPLEIFGDTYMWHIRSFESFVGVYGYMQKFAPRQYYAFFALLWLTFFAVLGWFLWKSGGHSRLLLVFLAGSLALAVGQSMYFSWAMDFQAQGRYLFPALPMLFAVMSRLPRHRREVLTITFAPAFFLLGMWSFLFVALS